MGKGLLRSVKAINKFLNERQRKKVLKQLNKESDYEQNLIQNWIDNSETPSPSYLKKQKKLK